MRSKTIQLENRSLEIKELPLKKYAALLLAARNISKTVGGIDILNNDQILKQLPEIIANSLPDLINILTITTDLNREEIEELGLNDSMKIMVAVIEVNNYKEVIDQIKKTVGAMITSQQ